MSSAVADRARVLLLERAIRTILNLPGVPAAALDVARQALTAPVQLDCIRCGTLFTPLPNGGNVLRCTTCTLLHIGECARTVERLEETEALKSEV